MVRFNFADLPQNSVSKHKEVPQVESPDSLEQVPGMLSPLPRKQELIGHEMKIEKETKH